MTNYYNPYQYAYQYQPQLQNMQQPLNQQAAQMLPTQMSGTSPQIQNGGFVSVRSIEEAFNWPVAPGNSLTFKVENSPYICTKTKGFSQLEAPIFERFRLVKEEDIQETAQNSSKTPENACKCDDQIKLLWNEINAIKGQIEDMRLKPKKQTKKEADQNEQIADSE